MIGTAAVADGFATVSVDFLPFAIHPAGCRLHLHRRDTGRVPDVGWSPHRRRGDALGGYLLLWQQGLCRGAGA